MERLGMVRRSTVPALLLAAGAALLGFRGLGVEGAPRPPESGPEVRPPGKTQRPDGAGNQAQVRVRESPPAQPETSSFARYRDLVSSNPFTPRLPQAPAGGTPPVLPDPAGAKKPEEKPAAKKPEGEAARPPEAPDALAAWLYTGTVIIGPEVYAVVETADGKRSRYLRAGEEVEGWTAQTVGQDSLLLRRGDARRLLPKSARFNATPLNAPPAPGSPRKEGTAHPPGAPQAPMSAPPPPGAAAGPAGSPRSVAPAAQYEILSAPAPGAAVRVR